MRAESTRKVAGPVIHLTVRFDNPSAGRLWSGWRQCPRHTTAQRSPVGDEPRGRLLPARRSARGATHRAATRTARSLPHGPIVLVLHVLDSEHLGQHQRRETAHSARLGNIRPASGHVEAAPQLSLDPPLTLLLSLWRHPAVAVNLNFAGRPNRHGRRNPTGALHSE